MNRKIKCIDFKFQEGDYSKRGSRILRFNETAKTNNHMTQEVIKKAMRGYRKALKGPTPAYLVDLGKQLKAAREKKELTQKQVADLHANHRGVYLQTGAGEEHHLSQLQKVCDALDCELKIRIV
jgi:DNA-binding Xre family transcriptional regulator